MYFEGVPSTAEIRDRLAHEREAAAVRWAEERTREAVEQWTRERDELVATITTFPERVRYERENFDNERATALHESEYNAKLTELTSHQYLLERTFNHVDRKAADLSGHADFGAAQIVREAQSVLLHEAAFPGSIPDAELGRATLTIHDKSPESVALREQAAQQELTIRQLHPELAIKSDPQIQHTIAQYASPLEVTAPELTQPAVRDATAAIERGNDGILRQDGTQIAREIENTGERMKVALRTDLQPESLRAMAEYALSQGYTNVTIRASEAHQDSLQARWREYTVVGMNVRGYEPTPADLQYVKEQRDLDLVAQARAGQAAVEKSGSEVGQTQTPVADAQPPAPAPAPANQTQQQQSAEPTAQTPSAPAVASQAPQQSTEQPVQAPSPSAAVEVSSPADATQPQQPAEKAAQTPPAPAEASMPAVASQTQQQAQPPVAAPSVAVDAAVPAVAAQAPQQEADHRHDMTAAARPGAGTTRDNPERVNVTRHEGRTSMSDRMVAQAPAERGSTTEQRMSDRMIAQRGDAPQAQQPDMSQRMANIAREDAAQTRSSPAVDIGGVPR